MRLVIDGEEQTELHRFVLRWAGPPYVPVLYCDGRRVTRAWRLEAAVEKPADPDGGNANTE